MIKKILITSSLIACTVLAADSTAEDWKVSGRLKMYLQSIDVDGGRGSAREGSTHNEELNLNFSGPLWDGKAGIQTRVRTTNDRRIQKDGAELLYLRSYFKNKLWNIELGDVAASLNPYIFNGSLKGVKAVYKSPEKDHTWDYFFISGFKKKSWRDTYTNELNEVATSYVGAFSAKYRHARAKYISLSLAGLKDDLSTGGEDSRIDGKEGLGLGVDGSWRFSKYVTLKGRGALTQGTSNLREDEDSKSSSAVYFKFLTRPVLKSVKSNFIYQRVDANFDSYGGNAKRDKEQIENSTTWKINKELRARMDLKYNRNNLDGESINGTQNTYYEALALTYKPSFIKRGSFDFKVSNKDIDDEIKDANRLTAGVNFSLRQKSGWRYGAGYDYSDQRYSDRLNSVSHKIKGLLGYKAKLSKTSSYRFVCMPNYQIIEDSQDKIGFKLDAGYVYSKKLSTGIMYMINDTKYDSLSTSKNTQNSTYQFRATYKLDAKGKNLVRLLLEKRDINVDGSIDSTYNEYKGKFSFIMNF